MRVPRLRFAALALVSGLALGGCAYDNYGDPYGYGGLSVGVGSGYYGGYGYGYPYGGYGYGYGYPYGGYGYGYGGYDPFGWYGNYYYPGSGIYVYDRHRSRHVWTDEQRSYWQERRSRWQSRTGSTTTTGENWNGWDRSRWRDRHNSTSVTTTTAGTSQTPRSFSNHSSSERTTTTRAERVRSSDSDSTPRHSRGGR